MRSRAGLDPQEGGRAAHHQRQVLRHEGCKSRASFGLLPAKKACVVVVSSRCKHRPPIMAWRAPGQMSGAYANRPFIKALWALLDLQNIDTDQIIPAEYLTLVPSKVSTEPSACKWPCQRFRNHRGLPNIAFHCSRMSMRSWAAMPSLACRMTSTLPGACTWPRTSQPCAGAPPMHGPGGVHQAYPPSNLCKAACSTACNKATMM